jgi:hypothetical protein
MELPLGLVQNHGDIGYVRDNIKDLNVLGRSAGKVSVEIHNKAIEEEAKQQPKSGS